jgi:hypothetical protein
VIEYKTTSASWNEHASEFAVFEKIPNPICPEGVGWSLVGSAATDGCAHQTLICPECGTREVLV